MYMAEYVFILFRKLVFVCASFCLGEIINASHFVIDDTCLVMCDLGPKATQDPARSRRALATDSQYEIDVDVVVFLLLFC